MNRLVLAAVLGLTMVGVARADLIPPGTRNIPVEHKIETDKDHPDWVFYTARGSGEVKAVKFDPKNPVVIAGSGAIGRGPADFRGRLPYRGCVLVAVPKDAVKAYPTERELHAAILAGKVPGAVETKPLGDHENGKLDDPRRVIAYRYTLVKIDPKDGIVLQPAKDPPKPEEEGEGASAPQSASRWLAAGLAGSAVVAFAGLWVIRRRTGRSGF